ncbi:glycosyltransferase family 4 protein [Pseudarthrobacter sp. O4]|uniref:glycosyltransferase family 4 protein n=1 Tax=Pseudarthrobacter sp. O4 TaxID=3418417 RepID=UPI003CE92FCA
MRIGIVAPPWIPVPPPGYGGIESVIDTLARGLVRAGHEVLLAAPQESTCPVRTVPGTGSAKGVTMGNTLDELEHVVRAYAAMADTDIIHDHTLAGPVYRHRPAGVPVVTTVHSPFAAKVRSLCRAFDADVAIVAISEHQAGTAADIPIAAVIHHGLAMDGIPVGRGDGGYACFLGRMHPHKGVTQAIEIARAGGVPLRIAAKMQNQQEHEYFNTQIRPRLSSNEEFLGEVGGLEKYELLGGALALINPIQWPEPFGMVMIESLAAGTPVLATPNGSAPEIVEDAVSGFLRSTTMGLVRALPDCERLDRTACRRAVEQNFSADRMVAAHLALYTEICAGTAAPTVAAAAPEPINTWRFPDRQMALPGSTVFVDDGGIDAAR